VNRNRTSRFGYSVVAAASPSAADATIWVPEGSHEDHTRDPRVLDAIASTLLAAGAVDLTPEPAADLTAPRMRPISTWRGRPA
jgi:hypothetical protein